MTLDASLDVSSEENAVRFVFTVTNVSDETVELRFPDGLTADVAVRTDDEEVWRWSQGRMFTQALEFESLAPGESITSELAWESPDSGSYTAEATLEASERDVTARATFDIEAD